VIIVDAEIEHDIAVVQPEEEIVDEIVEVIDEEVYENLAT